MKSVAFGTTGKKILFWSIIAVEPIADFSLSLGQWTSKNGSCDHDLNGEVVSLAKPFVFGIFSFVVFRVAIHHKNLH